ncbi:helix-turn-helix transcriptional regulator [Pseudoflavitalea sp. G-6-1-2]|uniref:helix-turn-helix transcriptional regulator n=1 Tax=Pseudoflavitalea sp. G-6-1-2 TaxID=2728841 RepID=UPI00146DA232|nr:helix-turn-helix transcriptional regulator [Pseudoflavitalea sp. G-6-1-2]NML24026.1 helix-turn-helix transcriptional regulator [Pseudoflavitalea sp. G-6-1-2]
MPVRRKRYNRIKLVLYENEKSNGWLAEKVGVKTVTVSKWCSNVNQPSIATLYVIADALEVSVFDLLVPNGHAKKN